MKTNDREVIFSSKSTEWNTPRELFNNLNKIYHFNLDAAATKENALCEKHWTKEDDALVQRWEGNVFCNPPYTRAMSPWLKKAYQESKLDDGVKVLLLPSRTSNRWFYEYCSKASRIYFIKGRLKFSGHDNSAPFPSMIVVFDRKHEGEFIAGIMTNKGEIVGEVL